MPFDQADNPFGGLDLSTQRAPEAELTLRPLDEISAEHDASRAAVQAEYGEAMDAEARRQKIGEVVFALATDGGEGEEHLGAYIEHETFPDGMNQCLYDAECRRRESVPDYDITTENPRRIARMLTLGLQHMDRQVERAEEETIEISETEQIDLTAEQREDGADRRAEWMAQFNGDFVAMVEAADGFPTEGDPVLEAEQAKLIQFQRILNVAGRVPADAEIIRERMRTVNFSQGVPDPVQFIQTAIFSSADYDSGVSQDTQDAIAAEFGITPTRPARPRNASEMQTTLREGRGTREIREIQTVEEPPGSGNFVEREVVVGEEPIPFEEGDPLVLSEGNPRVVAYPDPPGSDNYRFVGQVDGADPVAMLRNIPRDGAFPASAINNDMNEMLVDGVCRNHGLAGGLQGLLGISDGTLGVETDIDSNALGRTDLTQGFIGMCLGENTTLGGRFLTGDEMASIGREMRHLAPDGDFGAFNRMDATAAAQAMQAMFGVGNSEMLQNMNRAQAFINSGGVETPSYQNLYAHMYPEDAANGYERLRGIIGDDGMATLNLS